MLLARLPGAVGERARFVRARDRLDAGAIPTALREHAAALMARADAAHAAEDGEAAVDWADKALQLLFHPTVHYGPAAAPFADRSLALLAPLRESVVGRLLTADPDPERHERPGGGRVLVLSASSHTFVDRVMHLLGSDASVEVRHSDLSALEIAPGEEAPSRRGVLAARYRLATTGERIPVPAALAADLAWADVVWMEWSSYPAAWLTLLDGLEARVVVRLHRYEAYTPYPQLMAMAEVDELVLIAPHMQELVAAAAPRTAQAHRVRVLPNVNDLAGLSPAKEPGAERTLILVGWAAPTKDVEVALDVLAALHERDPGWRLLLAGRGPDARDPRAERVRRRMERLGDAVVPLGFRDDLPRVLRRAGYVLSTSRNEGSHESVVEGAAAGCVPVVRDWPENVAWGGAATVYPEAWVVPDVAGAVERILAVDAADRAAQGERARDWALADRDPAVLAAGYREVLTGALVSGGPGPGPAYGPREAGRADG